MQDAVYDAQMLSCQKCGLNQTVGPIKLTPGNVSCAWGTCLFLFTGIFCWVPCVVNGCKDTHVNCVRCGFKKAIIKPKCCC